MRGQGRPSSSAPAHSDPDWAKLPSCPDPAMGTRLLCWAALCLLGAELREAGVAQSPRYKVIEKSQAVTFWCNPVSGHATLYWYRQILGQGPELLVQFQNNDVVDDSQLPKDRFSAERLKGVNSTLKIQPAKLGDSAVYLCASSLATALQRYFPFVHKTAGLSPLYRLTAAFPYSSSSQGRTCTDAGIIQSPKHEVTEMGQAVTLRCEPILGHNLLFWYRQTFVQGLELLSYFWSRFIINDAAPSNPEQSFLCHLPHKNN
ncbi:uncharacterized protein LOC104681410 [Rhinopithecus roxellana]|uniref:uncharacterized protein LOC104681410 n=1 Tax=Rhinopithecus roxellana TaxID=61622 RepID=UPI001237817A|nr:uncharacterized protein LOC104681410 [Rhinopithecus roxellana]